MENEIKCPKCKGNSIVQGTKGFSIGKAVAGGLIAGPVGLLAGTHKSKDIRFTCLDCGHKFSVDDVLRMREAEKAIQQASIEIHEYQNKEYDNLTPEEREQLEAENERDNRQKKIIWRLVWILVLVYSVGMAVFAFYKSR